MYLFYTLGELVFGSGYGGSLGSLDGLQQAFSNKETLVGAWVHYLVFDLFVGAWMAGDAKRHQIHHFAIVIPLLLTFMAGPYGLLLYVAIKGVWVRNFSLFETLPSRLPARTKPVTIIQQKRWLRWPI